ncbi:hypothetical protein C5F48_14645 [Cereibacter changlensis JA139]|uniref:Uncharacterized protein n=1 Tax=Cereibacter changlensis JA139 TaxID=1188249 RepID=A0A2T4JSU1_9RHOB|nr:hypothetical protein C5F48_14645 [Cereibacter changlensis JA139]
MAQSTTHRAPQPSPSRASAAARRGGRSATDARNRPDASPCKAAVSAPSDARPVIIISRPRPDRKIRPFPILEWTTYT